MLRLIHNQTYFFKTNNRGERGNSNGGHTKKSCACVRINS